MLRKATSVTLAGVLLLSMASPVLAEEAKEVKEEVKVEQKAEVKEAKDKLKEVKEEAKEEVKEAKEEAKNEAKEAKKEVKEEIKEAKEEVKEAEKEVKEKVAEVKNEARKVQASTQKVKLDGKEVAIYGYNIDGENYFKLRDLAAVLKDSKAKFGVEYKDGLVTLTKGADYKVLDTDQKEVKAESQATLTNDKVMLGDKEITAKAYKVDGNNYYRIRDLAEVLDFGIGYDEESRTVLVSENKDAFKENETKEALKKEIAKEEKVSASEEYKKADVKDQANYDNALAAAKSIVNDKEAKDEQIENALKAIKEAQEKLGLKEEAKQEVKEEKKDDKKEVKEETKKEEK